MDTPTSVLLVLDLSVLSMHARSPSKNSLPMWSPLALYNPNARPRTPERVPASALDTSGGGCGLLTAQPPKHPDYFILKRRFPRVVLKIPRLGQNCQHAAVASGAPGARYQFSNQQTKINA